jgi:hypothetical protein
MLDDGGQLSPSPWTKREMACRTFDVTASGLFD